MHRHRRFGNASLKRIKVAVLLLALLVSVVSLLLNIPNRTGRAIHRFKFRETSKGYGIVATVIDGDTIQLSDGRIIRYIGIDTPEKGKPFYHEAKRANERLVLRKRVRLEFDVQKRDHYGRWLAYAFVKTNGEEIFVNAELVKLGCATTYTIPPNVKYADLFVKLQRQAVENKIGLWGRQRERVATYIGNKRMLTFHRQTCAYGRRVSPLNRILFKSRSGALKAGYRPCKVCKP